MEQKVVTFKDLDALIANAEDQPQKSALLILKGQCRPLRETGIPERVGRKILTTARSSEELLSKGFAIDEDDDMFVYHDDLGKACAKAIVLVFGEGE